jgi:hypothetical protein
VLKVTPIDSEAGVIVHFATRRDAESAFARGALFSGQSMKLDWFEEHQSQGQGQAAVGEGTATEATDGTFPLLSLSDSLRWRSWPHGWGSARCRGWGGELRETQWRWRW